jgi:hypothetical protein
METICSSKYAILTSDIHLCFQVSSSFLGKNEAPLDTKARNFVQETLSVVYDWLLHNTDV